MTKEEIKNLIAGITKENTTESLHADILTAIVDAMPGGGGEGEVLIVRLDEALRFSNENIALMNADYINRIWQQISGHDFVDDYETLVADIKKVENKIIKLVGVSGDDGQVIDGLIFTCLYYDADDTASIGFKNGYGVYVPILDK